MQSIIQIAQYKNLKEPPPGKNYLYFEKSLYLKQHEDNPVMWYPWCKEAFDKAKEENKLIFVSIGYSTCHWCHVMERESFSDPEIARLMNEVFVSIKIDREERPDLDRIFMRICEIAHKNCGWPLNVILTPDGLPIFVATYIPPETRRGMIGMKELIPKIKEIWEKDRLRCVSVGTKIISALEEVEKELSKKRQDVDISFDLLNFAFESIKQVFDPEFGGFGNTMKFPNPSVLSFLLRFYRRTGNKEALYMVEKTLIEMRYGGIYDHIGGGFHRYAVERSWTIPHFEKMLYDNAQLIELYLEAYQLTKRELYKQTVIETAEYVLGNLYDKEVGLFYSAQDAESEGEEGKYYLWEYDEIKNILGDKTKIFSKYFGIQPYGVVDGKNVLRISYDIDELSREYGIPLDKLSEMLWECLEKLKTERAKRVPPHVDKKILVDINSLMIKALSKMCFVLGDSKFLALAQKGADKILEFGNIPHVIYDGNPEVDGVLEDYAFFSEALLELFFSSQKIQYLESAKNLIDKMIELFYDEKEGGFFAQKQDSDFVFVRQKDSFDGATPSGNSSAIMSCLKMYRVTGDKKYLKIAEDSMKIFLNSLISSPIYHSYLLCAIDFYLGPTYEIVIAVNELEESEVFLSALREIFFPQKILLVVTRENKEILSRISTFLSSFPLERKVYVCTEGVCKEPIENPEDLGKIFE